MRAEEGKRGGGGRERERGRLPRLQLSLTYLVQTLDLTMPSPWSLPFPFPPVVGAQAWKELFLASKQAGARVGAGGERLLGHRRVVGGWEGGRVGG